MQTVMILLPLLSAGNFGSPNVIALKRNVEGSEVVTGVVSVAAVVGALNGMNLEVQHLRERSSADSVSKRLKPLREVSF